MLQLRGKIDPLYGLKENVIIGKLIPAGTGMPRYRNTGYNSTCTAARIMNFSAGSGRYPEYDSGRQASPDRRKDR